MSNVPCDATIHKTGCNTSCRPGFLGTNKQSATRRGGLFVGRPGYVACHAGKDNMAVTQRKHCKKPRCTEARIIELARAHAAWQTDMKPQRVHIDCTRILCICPKMKASIKCPACISSMYCPLSETLPLPTSESSGRNACGVLSNEIVAIAAAF